MPWTKKVYGYIKMPWTAMSDALSMARHSMTCHSKTYQNWWMPDGFSNFAQAWLRYWRRGLVAWLYEMALRPSDGKATSTSSPSSSATASSSAILQAPRMLIEGARTKAATKRRSAPSCPDRSPFYRISAIPSQRHILSSACHCKIMIKFEHLCAEVLCYINRNCRDLFQFVFYVLFRKSVARAH